MTNDRQLADAILARIPAGCDGFEIARRECKHLGGHWCVTMHDEAMRKRNECVSETDTVLSSALAKANVNYFRKRAENERRAGIALAYARDMGVSA